MDGVTIGRRAGRRLAIGMVALVAVGVGTGLALHQSSPAPPAAPAAASAHGYDVSWPQCAETSVGHMPAGRPSYVILGLTHGAGGTVNPCLGAQLEWAKSRGVRVGAYLVATFPPKAQQALSGNGPYGVCGTSTLCRLRNNGAAQAEAAVATMHQVGLAPPLVWIDVEVGRALPWSGHAAANRAVLQGVARGLRAAHLAIGVYTTVAMWTEITRGLRLDVPNWLPSGDRRARHAAGLCPTTATGGVTWLVQYTRSLDADLTCAPLEPVPGVPGALWPYRKTTLQLGSTGAAVSAVQQKIGVAASGSYDAATVAAVKTWQKSMQLPVTGTIGPADWRALGADRLQGGHGLLLSRITAAP
jgi:hypothetical protein